MIFITVVIGYCAYLVTYPAMRARRFDAVIQPGLSRLEVLNRLAGMPYIAYSSDSQTTLNARLQNYEPKIECTHAFEVIVFQLGGDRIGLVLLTKEGYVIERHALRT